MNEIQRSPEEQDASPQKAKDARATKETLIFVTLVAVSIGAFISTLIPYKKNKDDSVKAAAPHRTLAEMDQAARDEAAMPAVMPRDVGDLDNGIFGVGTKSDGVSRDGGIDSRASKFYPNRPTMMRRKTMFRRGAE